MVHTVGPGTILNSCSGTSTRSKIPNPHAGDIDVSLLGRILRENGIEKDEWINA